MIAIRSILRFSLPLVLTGCYYGPGVSRVETNAIRRSARDLNPVPIIAQQTNSMGQNIIAPMLDSTLTPLILGGDEYQDPKTRSLRQYDENMRRQQEAMDAMDRELDELHKNSK